MQHRKTIRRHSQLSTGAGFPNCFCSSFRALLAVLGRWDRTIAAIRGWKATISRRICWQGLLMSIHYHNHTIHVQAQAAGTAKRLKQDMANAQAGFLRRRELDGEGGMLNGQNSVQTNVDARLSDSPDCLREGLEQTGAGLDGGSSRQCQSVRHPPPRPKTGWPETFFGGCSPRGKTALVRIRGVEVENGWFQPA
jgi:hypothetical protein